MSNKNLIRAKVNAQDEFYTQLSDIQKELAHYTEHFKGKTVYCNCSSPEFSQFYIYFLSNFNKLKLKSATFTFYSEKQRPYRLTISDNATKVERTELQGNGDFASDECVKILDESDIIVENPPFSCHSADTEVLTDKGWKLFKDVNVHDDLILSMNIDTRQMEYVGITDTITQDYHGPMYHFNSKFIDQLVTPNHRMVVHRKGKATFRCAEDIKDESDRMERTGYTYISHTDNEYFMLQGCTQTEQHTRKEVAIPDRQIPINDWLEFFGFWLADGCTRQGVNTCGKPRYTTSIKQSMKNREYVMGLYDRIGFNCKEYPNASGNNNYEVYSKQLWLELNKYGRSHDKHIPREILNLPKERLQYLLKGYMMGDGEYANEKQCVMQTVSSQLMDDLIEVFLKVNGKILHKNEVHTKYKGQDYVLYMTRYSEHNKDGIKYHHEVEQYDGTIYCFTLEKNHTMLVRRNGKPTWSGNCFRDYINLLHDHNKKFLIIGGNNAISYRDVFRLMMTNELWLGYGMPKYFVNPTSFEKRPVATYWYTNLGDGKKNKPIPLTKKYDPRFYPKYDNYDAINVDNIHDIPYDYLPEVKIVNSKEELDALVKELKAKGTYYTIEELPDE